MAHPRSRPSHDGRELKPIKAVKTDTYGVTRLKYPHGTTPDPQNPPRGTQREYHLPTDHGEMKVFIYIQGGHINGWHVEK